MASPVEDKQPPAYESLIRGDRNVSSYVDISQPKYESVIDTEAYYVMPNPPVAPTSEDRKSHLYDNAEDKTVYHIYADIHANERDVCRSPSQDR